MAKEKAKSKEKTKAKAKGEKELTPLEKARLARAKDGGKTKTKTKKKIEFKAPEGEKPFFIKAVASFDRDGVFTDLKATRIKGNPEKDTAKTVDLEAWDHKTLRRLAIRYAGGVFIRNEKKRLEAKSQALLLLRVAIKGDTRVIKVSLKSAKFKTDGGKAKALDKKNPIYRALRKPANFLAGAFTQVRPFPTNAELKELLAEKGGDE